MPIHEPKTSLEDACGCSRIPRYTPAAAQVRIPVGMSDGSSCRGLGGALCSPLFICSIYIINSKSFSKGVRLPTINTSTVFRVRPIKIKYHLYWYYIHSLGTVHKCDANGLRHIRCALQGWSVVCVHARKLRALSNTVCAWKSCACKGIWCVMVVGYTCTLVPRISHRTTGTCIVYVQQYTAQRPQTRSQGLSSFVLSCDKPWGWCLSYHVMKQSVYTNSYCTWYYPCTIVWYYTWYDMILVRWCDTTAAVVNEMACHLKKEGVSSCHKK